MTTIVDKLRYNPPTRKDHLLKVPREVLYASADDEYEYVADEEKRLSLMVEAKPRRGNDFLVYSGIVCDFCNQPIPYPYVWILICGGYSRGVICEDCRKRYHNDKPALIVTKVDRV